MHRRVFVQRSVSSRSIIVACVAAQDAAQMRLAKDDDVVQAFPANGPNQSFGKAVLPWRPRCDGFVANSHCTQAMSYDGAKDAIPVADQIPRRRIPGERFRDLACNPFRRWATRHTYPDELSAIEPNDYESIEQAERKVGTTNRSIAAISGGWLRRNVHQLWPGGPPAPDHVLGDS